MASTSADVEPNVQPPHAAYSPSVESLHRRIFVGPFPNRIIAYNEAQVKRTKLTIGSVFSLVPSADPSKLTDGDKIEEVYRLLKEHAFQFFIHEGGKPEDWDEQDEDSIADELVKKWKESEWGQLWSHRYHRRNTGEPSLNANDGWFGTSFEVGNLLGVNVLQGLEHISAKVAHPEGTSTLKSPTSTARLLNSDMPQASLAQSGAFSRTMTIESSAISHYESAKSVMESLDNQEGATDTPTSSITGLLNIASTSAPAKIQKAKSSPHFRPPLIDKTAPAKSEGHMKTDTKGKGRMVHYHDDLDIPTRDAPHITAAKPVSPQTMLNRTKITVEPNTSAAAAVPPDMPESNGTNESEDIQWGDVLMRDRMLIRISHTKNEGITHFDDALNRTTRDLHFEDWGEFLVAWRRDRLEIYCDHNTPGKEWIIGHKHLAYVVPLRSSRAKLSLYSFVDATFCITCPPTTTRVKSTTWVLNREKGGVDIFIFKIKSRSRASDWIWQLWRFMGGQIPTFIEVHNPRLSTKVKIDIPQDDVSNVALYRTFTRDNVIELCMQSLRDVPDLNYVAEEQIGSGGKSFQLAWRVNADLDWIWLDDDITGKPREWSVLYGIAFRQLASKPPTLDIRIASHALTRVHLRNGTHVDEPPSVEGYLDRIRPNTQTKQQTYLSTHNGCLFTLNTFQAFPPMPPGLTPPSNIYTDAQYLRHAEIRRGINQVMSATGMLDLRTIVAIRRASHPTPSHVHNQKEATQDEAAWFAAWGHSEEVTAEDEGDEGGDGGLGKVGDRSRTRIARSFELLLTTGHVVRFEAHSCQVAIEWTERLRALIFYWKNRHRVDAHQEIELAQAARPRLTPQTRVHDENEEVPPDAPVDQSMPYAAMDHLHNWCVLEGCKPIVKGGRLYMKKGLRGQYQLIQLYLVAGHLVRFRIDVQSSLYPAIRQKINLIDAYVYSGYFAAQTLPQGQYMPNAPPTPRRYQDGLETDDREEDMLFIVQYRSYPQMINADQDPTTTPMNVKNIPNISAKHKTLVFKTRSILERDAWCWALNSEIEKIVRAQKGREEALRETGNLLK